MASPAASSTGGGAGAAPLVTSGPLSSFAPLTAQPATVPPRPRRSLLMEWMLAGSATMGACLFSNPFEVVKTRMQVEGELARQGRSDRLYRNPLQAFADIGRREGLRALQSGLGPACLYQLTMNGTRLGLYEPLKRLIAKAADDGRGSRSAHAPPVFWQTVVAAGISGATAAFIGSPFFLVKVRLQVQNRAVAWTGAAATASTAAGTAAGAPAVVGAQHHYTGVWQGLRQIYAADGVTGLFRGASASMIRVTCGGVTQLATYDQAKHAVLQRTGWADGARVHFAASLLSSFLVVTAMQPADVISTRLYNQPVVEGRGTLYSGWVDCARKIATREGPSAFLKGFWAHYLRLGPHSILTFVFWEKLKTMATKAGY